MDNRFIWGMLCLKNIQIKVVLCGFLIFTTFTIRL